MKKTPTRIVIGAVVVAILAFYFVNPFDAPTWDLPGRFAGLQLVRSPGAGMEPAIARGSLSWVCFSAFRGREPRVNDIIVFRVPGNEDIRYLKRVAAVAGSTIEIRDGDLLVDGVHVTSTFWLSREAPSSYSTTLAPTVVPAGSVYVLGDNLEQSINSRRFGAVPLQNLVGGLCTTS